MEEINCLNCVNITSDFLDCSKYCGAEKGWCAYQPQDEVI